MYEPTRQRPLPLERLLAALDYQRLKLVGADRQDHEVDSHGECGVLGHVVTIPAFSSS